jgi:hypothetical protein
VMSNAGFALVGILGVIAVVGVSRHACRPGEPGVCLVSLGAL